jgi:hypothetical protein
MALSREGAGTAAVPLGSGQSAMTALAQCLGQNYSAMRRTSPRPASAAAAPSRSERSHG